MNDFQNDNRFEDRLLSELRPIVASNPEPASAQQTAAHRRRQPARRLALAGSMALALAAVAAVIAATGDPESAYAVDKADNGAISVEVHSLSDAAGLEAKLRAAGVDATVNYNAKDACVEPEPRRIRPGTAAGGEGPSFVKGESKHVAKGESGARTKSLDSAGSPPPDGAAPPDGPGPGGIAIEQGKDGARFTITPGALPKDGKLIIDANLDGGLHSLGVAIVKGEAPDLKC